MRLLLDSFWRAVAYCLLPRVIWLSLLPLVIMLAAGGVLWYFFWDGAVAWAHGVLQGWPFMTRLWGWIGGSAANNVQDVLAPLGVALGITPLVVVISVVLVAALMSPALTRLVATRRFSTLEEKKGGTLVSSVLRSLSATVLAVIALVLSMPFWLIPPLVLILPPLIWGWLTYRVMSFDALADHASVEEREAVMRLHRTRLLGIGVLCGYLGTAPSIVWASGLLFAAAFVVLVPIAIWIYMLVFAFSALWYGHYCLEALAQLRAQRALAAPRTASAAITLDPLNPPQSAP